jgi:hypothetical protein
MPVGGADTLYNKQQVSMMKQIISKAIAFLGSPRFFWTIIAFFVLEGLWLVFSALYPMAFDEEIHLGIIEVYAQQWSPFLGAQPEHLDYLGALSSDPSYLYHYLMSFPYRLISFFTDNQMVVVILLRLLNLAIFTGALLLFRKVLLRAKTSPALAHVILAVVVLIPIAPLLAAHINYDNLLMLLMAWICWLVLGVIERLRLREFPLRQLGLLAVACMLASLVKYAALPIFAAALVFVGFYAWYCFRGHGKRLGPAFKKSLTVLSLPVKIGLVVAVLLSSVLFLQRYGVNAYRYQAVVPECHLVLSEARCQAFSPWRRNQRMAREKGQFDHSLLNYTETWLYFMRWRTFFTVNGPHHGYATREPLPVTMETAGYLTALSFLLVIVFWRRIFRGRPELVFFTAIIALYTIVLWLNGYADYLHTGEPVAINGRYFLPIIVLMGAVIGRAFSLALGRWSALKVGAAAVVLLLFLQGGGVMTFILRSDPGWYWPSQNIETLNHNARNVLKPLIIEGSK